MKTTSPSPVFRDMGQHGFDPETDLSSDVLIIGSGMGGAAFAAGLASTGLKVRMLEAGDFIPDAPDNRTPQAVYHEMRFHSRDRWLDKNDRAFVPGTYEWVGGNSKFFGAVLYRFREIDFHERHYAEGISPAWPFDYGELQPWYEKAERMLHVRGVTGEDSTEPSGPYGYDFPKVPDEPAIAELRRRLEIDGGIGTATLPLGVDTDAWLAEGQGPWDGYPDATCQGKMEAESRLLPLAAQNKRFKLITSARATRLLVEPGGSRIASVVFERDGREWTHNSKLVVVAAGAVNSAALLLRSGVANSSDQVGRNFMNHIFSVLIAIDPRFRNTSAYQKTITSNAFYDTQNDTGQALGNIQLLGRLYGDTLAHDVKYLPRFALNWIADHSAHFFLQTEDVPKPENRVTLKGDRIKLEWHRDHIPTHQTFVKRAKQLLRDARFPIVLHRLMDEALPYHQCGTVCMGSDSKTSVLNPQNVSWDHPNLIVADASALVSSAGVNPALTVAALSLRAAHHALDRFAQL
ncbi:GMC family oxidoreductase N-terminal domain-containing protein [Litoreibacter roseus]|uniref:Dehydrogenase n=1 Tax=Litoreibacter roseus TaxID=2601869 RepID=A0A6N6JNU4_9RHOB|nr:GMC family oxidoreductase [Litoreibacter roseus]GFE67062.1 dehydrogenase [Litoreibacter roseus]